MASNVANPERSRWRVWVDHALGGKAQGALTGSRIPGEIVADGGAPGVLAFHGFGGTPFEVELVVEAARTVKLTALAPLLPGHGTHARDLARTRYADWVDAAEKALARVPRPCIVGGLSMGSLLAIELAVRRPDQVAGLVLLANASWLTAPFPCWALEVAERLRLPDFLAPKKGPDIGDFESRESHIGYDCHPVHAAIEVLRAGEKVRERLSEVRCPTLILHGARDRVCPVANAWRVAERLGTSDRRVVIYPKSHHILTRDVERESVREELLAFFARVAHSLPARSQTPVDP